MSASGFLKSLKRKAEQISDPNNDKAPISAVAAARAWRERQSIQDADAVEAGDDLDPSYATDDSFGSEDGDAPASESEATNDVSKVGSEISITERKTSAPDVVLSTWSPSEQNIVASERGVNIILEPNERVTLLGEYGLQVKIGSVSIYGAALVASPHVYHVFAPTTHALPCIVCNGTVAAHLEISSRQTLQALGPICPLFRRLWSNGATGGNLYHEGLAMQKSFTYVHHSRDDPRPLYPLITSSQAFNSILAKMEMSPGRAKQILLSGRKGAGKSTFGRSLANHILSSTTLDGSSASVCWLDLDPGQPEFGLPGQVSLVHVREYIFGPNYTHAYMDAETRNVLIAAHSIGSTSPVGDPEGFLARCVDLHTRYQRLLAQFPNSYLIVNCPGWTSAGSALDVALALVEQLPASDAVFVGETSLANGTDPFLVASKAKRMHRIKRSQDSPPIASRHAAQLRDMQTASYFHSCDIRGRNLAWNATPISLQPPLTATYGGETANILGILTQSSHVSNPKHIVTVLDKWPVAVCIVEDDAEAHRAATLLERTQQEDLPYWPLANGSPVYQLSPSTTRVLGWAYISGIDTEKRTLALVTPLPKNLLGDIARTPQGNSRVVLVRGMTDAPRWAYMENIQAEQYKAREKSKLLVDSESDAEVPSHGLIVIPDFAGGDYDEAAAEAQRPMGTDYVSWGDGVSSTGLGQKHWIQKPRILGRR